MNRIECKLVFFVLLLVFTLNSCDNNNDLTEENRNLIGEPYKFKFEISADEPNDLYVKWGGGHYFYDDKNGTTQSTLFYSTEIVLSPLIKEVDVPRNFSYFIALATSSSLEPNIPSDNSGRVLKGKLYVNNKLLLTYTSELVWNVSIQYSNHTKKYMIVNSLDEVVELDKID